MGGKKIDLKDMVFGKLKVVGQAEDYTYASGSTVRMWLCECECGEQIKRRTSALQSGKAKSCGCDNYKDLTNMRFGNLVALNRVEDHITSGGRPIVQWACRCDCGQTTIVRSDSLLSGRTKSCRCGINKINDLTNMTFGKLTVIKRAPNSKKTSGRNKTMWECLCECGETIITSADHLNQGNTTTCGKCDKSEDLTGMVFGELEVLRRAKQDYYSADGARHPKWTCLCRSCNREVDIMARAMKQGTTKSCGCVSSHGEKKLLNVLSEMREDFKAQAVFDTCANQATGRLLRFDFELCALGILIEYDGVQHFQYNSDWWGAVEGYISRLKLDHIKDNWCIVNRKPMLRIPYTEYDLIDEKYLQNAINLALENAKNGQMITLMNPEIYNNRASIEDLRCA